MTLPAWGWAIASVIVGGGLVLWIVRRLNQAEADKIDAVSKDNWIQGQIDATAAEQSAKEKAKEAKDVKNDTPATDW